MKNPMIKICLLAVFCMCSCAMTQAQSGATDFARKIEAAKNKILLTGAKPADFLAGEWKIYRSAKGDLNGDGLPDYALDLLLASDADGTGCYDAVLILFGEKSGRLRRTAFNDKLSSSGFFSGESVSIRNGILIVKSSYGSGERSTSVTYRFRYDRAAAELLLTGFDYETASGMADEDFRQTSSRNFLTGVHLVTDSRFDGSKSSTKQTLIERVRISFEKARFNGDDSVNDPLPF